jgi:hypothetical protein
MRLSMDIQSFKERLVEQIEKLKKTAGFQDSLMDSKHREAFYKLIDEAWFTEEKAMEKSGIPDIMNNLILVANTHNKMEIEALSKKILEMQECLHEIEKQKET